MQVSRKKKRRKRKSGYTTSSEIDWQDRLFALRSLGFSSYKEYLSSELWASIRQRVLAEKGSECSCCTNKCDVIHHEYYSYETLSGQCVELLWPLCDRCHSEVHFSGKNKRMKSICSSSSALRRKIKWKKRRRRENEEDQHPAILECEQLDAALNFQLNAEE